MKKQSLILGVAIAATLSSGMAIAELSANLGVVSTYYFRGVQQTAGASGSGGVDYDFGNGASIGIWAADVGGHATSTDTTYSFTNTSSVGTANTLVTGSIDETDTTAPNSGIEYDLYGSYSGEAGDISYSVGYTLYLYTGSFDTSYSEVNLGAGYGPVAVDVAIGSYEGGGSTAAGAPDLDYTFISVSGDVGPVAVTYGTWGSDLSGSYIELGIGTEIGGADVGISLINSDADASDLKNFVSDGTALVFSLSKGFEL